MSNKIKLTPLKPKVKTFGNGVRLNDYGKGKPKTVSQLRQPSYIKIK
jgi:hypothetical protein